MAANSQDYGSLPENVPTSAPKSSKRAIASVVVAVMLFAGAAVLNKTATAPAALAAHDGSGVTWDCEAPNAYELTSQVSLQKQCI